MQAKPKNAFLDLIYFTKNHFVFRTMFSKLFVRVEKSAICRNIDLSGSNILTTLISSRNIFRKSLPVISTNKKKKFPIISSQEFLKHSDDPTTTVHINSQNRHREVSSVIPKVCSADHWWSARLFEMVRESL